MLVGRVLDDPLPAVGRLRAGQHPRVGRWAQAVARADSPVAATSTLASCLRAVAIAGGERGDLDAPRTSISCMNRGMAGLWRQALGGRMACMLLVAVGGAACSVPAAPCVCTLEFRIFTVTVLNASGEPAEGVSISVRRVSDGADLTEPNDLLPTPGVYVILTDGNRDDVSENGTAVEVVGTLGDTGFTAEYVFDRDACNCHVNKVSGPDTVQLEPLPLG